MISDSLDVMFLGGGPDVVLRPNAARKSYVHSLLLRLECQMSTNFRLIPVTFGNALQTKRSGYPQGLGFPKGPYGYMVYGYIKDMCRVKGVG